MLPQEKHGGAFIFKKIFFLAHDFTQAGLADLVNREEKHRSSILSRVHGGLFVYLCVKIKFLE